MTTVTAIGLSLVCVAVLGCRSMGPCSSACHASVANRGASAWEYKTFSYPLNARVFLPAGIDASSGRPRYHTDLPPLDTYLASLAAQGWEVISVSEYETENERMDLITARKPKK